jgi:hypothetical protein
MCVPFQSQICDCRTPCPCGEILTVDEEIRKMGVMRQHLQFQLELIERRMSSLKNVRG